MKTASSDDDDYTPEKNSSKGGRTYHPELKEALNQKGTSVEKFLAESRLEDLMKRYRPSQLKQLDSDDPLWCQTFKKLEPVDVVYPAINGPRSSLGNALMTPIVALNLQYFTTLKTKERRIAIDAIVGHFETLGTKFLEAPPRNQTGPNKTYRALSLQGIITKVLYLFRIHGFRVREKKKKSLEPVRSQESKQSLDVQDGTSTKENKKKTSTKGRGKKKTPLPTRRDSVATVETVATEDEDEYIASNYGAVGKEASEEGKEALDAANASYTTSIDKTIQQITTEEPSGKHTTAAKAPLKKDNEVLDTANASATAPIDKTSQQTTSQDPSAPEPENSKTQERSEDTYDLEGNPKMTAAKQELSPEASVSVHVDGNEAFTEIAQMGRTVKKNSTMSIVKEASTEKSVEKESVNTESESVIEQSSAMKRNHSETDQPESIFDTKGVNEAAVDDTKGMLVDDDAMCCPDDDDGMDESVGVATQMYPKQENFAPNSEAQEAHTQPKPREIEENQVTTTVSKASDELGLVKTKPTSGMHEAGVETQAESQETTEESDTENESHQMNRYGMWHTGPLKQFVYNRKEELERFVSGSELEILMCRYRPSRLSQLDDGDRFFNECLKDFRSIDVITPFPDERHAHLGNAVLNYVAALNVKCFTSLSPLNQRSAIDAIVSHFESLGTRFLEARVTGGPSAATKLYQPMNLKAVVRVISHVFRDFEKDLTEKKGKSETSSDEDAVRALILLGSAKEDGLDKSRPVQKGEGIATRISQSKSRYLVALDANLKNREHQIRRFVADANLESLVKAYNPSQPSTLLRGEDTWGSVFHSVRPVDILYPQQGPRSQLGNALMNDVIAMNTDYYGSLNETNDRKVAIDALVSYFERLGTRFLEALPKSDQVNDNEKVREAWRAMSYKTLCDKMTKTFRTQLSRKKKEMKQSTEQDENPKKESAPIPAPKQNPFALSARARVVLLPIDARLKKKGSSLDLFIEEANLELLPRRSSKLIQATMSQTRCYPDAADILFGSGGFYHPGNILMEIVVRRNKDFMHGLSDSEKAIAADSLIAHFEESCGTRFLETRISDGRLVQASHGVVSAKLLSGLCRSDNSRQMTGALRSTALAQPLPQSFKTAPDQGGQENRRAPLVSRSKNAPVLQPHVNIFRRCQKRSLAEVDSFYQSARLHKPKRSVLAPRPVFFRDA